MTAPLAPEWEATLRAQHEADPEEAHSCRREYPCPFPGLFATIDDLRAKLAASVYEQQACHGDKETLRDALALYLATYADTPRHPTASEEALCIEQARKALA